MKWISACLFLFVIFNYMALAKAEKNEVPPEVVKALHAPDKVTLYSLEPWEQPTDKDEKLHGFKILGQSELDAKQTVIAVREFETAVSGWDGAIAMCFDPRQALRVSANKHTYDLLLCYACHQLYIYRDGESMAQLGAHGSSKILKDLLTEVGLPISKTEETEEEKAAARKEAEIARKRWDARIDQAIVELGESPQ